MTALIDYDNLTSNNNFWASIDNTIVENVSGFRRILTLTLMLTGASCTPLKCRTKLGPTMAFPLTFSLMRK